MVTVDSVHVLETPGIYETRSLRSATVYWVDTRPFHHPRYLRIRGTDAGSVRLDALWNPLNHLVSGPREHDGQRFSAPGEIDITDEHEWLLRTGSAHHFYALDVDYGSLNGVWATPCASITVHEEMPAILAAYPHLSTLDAIDAMRHDDG